MKTLKSNKVIFLFMILFSVCCIALTSCKKKTESEKTISETMIDAQILIEIAESNLKIVAIAKKAQESNIEDSSKIVFETIEQDHIELKDNIKEMAKNHLIIIPTILYDKTALKNSMSKINSYKFLNKTEDLLNAELKYYNTTVITSNNNELKSLATEAISKIEKNINTVQQLQL